MLTENEQFFVDSWEKIRDHEKKLSTRILRGIPLGLLFSMPVMIVLFTGRFWYKRADMILYTKTSPWVLIISIFIITVLFAAFYRYHKWEMKEQQYHELLRKKNKN